MPKPGAEADDQTPVAGFESSPDGEAELARGTTVDRYVVLGRAGSGGMGVVYAAYDPDLDRRVALKLLRAAGPAGSEERSQGRARLMREAQALARLSHPNVVPVHDVGGFDDLVFIAMEFVEGRPLTAWLREKRRPWRDALPVFVHAGRGLLAAHTAGIVHRDFKPDNVIVGKGDDDVRVVDFGLARALGEATAQEAEPAIGLAETSARSARSGALGLAITKTGTVMGTPAYMAPEQILGRPADARTDQFSFCVSLYEALYGQRPFDGETYQELAVAVLGGRVRPEPAGTDVPAWLRHILLRGLSPRTEERFPSMNELLAALAADPAAVRRRWAFRGVAGAAVVALAVALVHARAELGGRCSGAEAKLAGVWDAPRREAVRRAFLATGAPYAAAAWEGVSSALDKRADGFVHMHTDACEATSVRGEQSAALLDLRMACLERRLDELRATTGLFTEADVKVVQRAVAAVSDLPEVALCADLAALQAAVRPPEDPALRAKVDELRRSLAIAAALERAGKYAEGLAHVKPIAEEARRLPHLPLRAEALYRLGTLLERTGDYKAAESTLLDAVFAAEAGRHDELAPRIWSRLVFTVGYVGHRLEEGLRHAARAEAAIARIGSPPDIESGYWNNLGTMQTSAGRHEESVASHRRALVLSEKAHGPDHLEVAASLHNLSIPLRHVSRYDEALTTEQRALAIRQNVLGADHPDVASSLNTLANIHHAAGRVADAIAPYDRAAAIQERALGADHPDFASTLTNLGTVQMSLGKLDEAIKNHRRALAINEKAFGPDHADVAISLMNLGSVYDRAGRRREGEAVTRRALATLRKTVGPDHPDVGIALFNLGDLVRKENKEKRTAEAKGLLRESLAILEKQLPPDNSLLAYPLTGLGQIAVAEHKHADAIAPLERARSIRLAAPGDPADLADTDLALAQALWGAGRDRPRAATLGESARDGFEKAGAARSEDLAAAKTWIGAHPALGR